MNLSTKPFNAELAQIAWVVKDVGAAEAFFKSTMGIEQFVRIDNMRSQDSKAMYYGQPADFVTHVRMAYSGGCFIELIEPVSGKSVFQDYLDKHPEGGLQHIAYRMPVVELDAAVEELKSKGYSVISSFDTSIARIVFFDTYDVVGVATELMGITKEGEEAVEKMKQNSWSTS
jgi:hypothetical protein